jgi:glycosyltransferase involved in cell wall biosynthesis
MHPRILVYSSEIPQTGVAGGLLLYRLLKGLASDQLAVVGWTPRPESKLLDCAYHAPRTPWRRFEYSRFNRLHRTLRTLRLVPLISVAETDRLLGGFQADVVVTVMQFGTWYDSAMRYARSKGIPLVTIVHDPNEVFDRVYGWAQGLRNRADGRFFRFARKRLCISPEMEALCFRKFGVHGEVMYPNRDPALKPRAPADSESLKKPGQLTLGYAGTLGYGYGDQLVRLLPAFRASGSKLVIYGKLDGPARDELERESCIELRGFVKDPHDAFTAIKRDCDAVILPYLNPPDEIHRQLYSCHFPSKLAEYVALGMPVVVTGPPVATGVRWGLANADAVMTETDPDPAALARRLVLLKADPALRVRLAGKSIGAGSKDFDPASIRGQFYAALAASLGSPQT